MFYLALVIVALLVIRPMCSLTKEVFTNFKPKELLWIFAGPIMLLWFVGMNPMDILDKFPEPVPANENRIVFYGAISVMFIAVIVTTAIYIIAVGLLGIPGPL